MIEKLTQLFRTHRLPVHNEKETQQAIEKILTDNSIAHIKELKLDDDNIPDFFITVGEIAMEVKIKGNAKKIYKQCERYAMFDQVKQLILITNRSMGFPGTINNKPCYVVNIGRAWL